MYIKTKLLLHITGNINEFVRRNVKSNRTQKCIPVKKKTTDSRSKNENL